MLFGNFFIAYKLRDLQNMGTSWKFVLVYAVLLLVFTILNFSAALVDDCNKHGIQAAGYCGYFLCQAVTVIMLFTVRQNSLANYSRLPVWFVTLGSLFQLSMTIILVYQSIYLTKTDNSSGQPAENFGKIIKSLYLVGLFGPILNWFFIYFLITRLNEKVRHLTDPNFVSTEESYIDNDE